ncbi:MAG: ABC transporter ATP-binding protein [Vicinamibacterales bacterium]
MAMLEVDDLRTYFRTPDGVVKAVDGVSFSLEPGETLGIVGESGSGKSVTALSVMRLNPMPPGYHPSGEIRLAGENLLDVSEQRMQRIRGNDVAAIFQDPMTSLNPVFTVGGQIAEAIRVHRDVSKGEARRHAIRALGDVGIPNPEARARDYPHQFSGGMRQRAMIAMALSCSPKLLIADEPTTALDVTIQAQILELLQDLSRRLGVAMLIITHNLGVVARYADRVNVMYAGRVIERGTAAEIYADPRHPYTLGLLRSVPRLDEPMRAQLDPIEGQPPDLTRLPPGCAFAPRCAYRVEHCTEVPPLEARGAPGHLSACWESARLRRKAAA